MNGPLSVAINAYRRADFVWGAVRSVLTQDSPAPLEVLVVSAVEGLSVPSEIERRAVERSASVKVVPAPDGPVGKALVAAAKSARGEFVALLDDDDLWAPRKIGWMESAIESVPSVGYLHNSQTFVNGADRPLGPLDSHRLLRHPSSLMRAGRSLTIDPSNARSLAAGDPFSPDFNNSSLAIRRSILLEAGPDLERVRRGEDTFLYYCALSSGRPLALTSDRLTRYRIHAYGATTALDPGSNYADRLARFAEFADGHLESLDLAAGRIPRTAISEIRASIERDRAFWRLLRSMTRPPRERGATAQDLRIVLGRDGVGVRAKDALSIALGAARMASPTLTRLAFDSWRQMW
jgi:glycosyltransferase involved in cell wall biosynthesis